MNPIEFLLHHDRTGGTDLIGQVILITEGYEIGLNVCLSPAVLVNKKFAHPYFPVI